MGSSKAEPMIEIDEWFTKDPRFDELYRLLNHDKVLVYGSVVNLWMIGRANWRAGRKTIPKKAAALIPNMEQMIRAEFVEERPDGYYVKGAARRWGKAGKKITARTSKVSPVKKSTSKSDEQLSLKKSEPNEETQQLRKETWEAYRSAYSKRWRQEPGRNATVNAQIASLVSRLGSEAPQVLEFYVGHNDGFYVKKCHPVGLALKDAESLLTQWRNKRPITGATMKQFETQQHFREQIERAENGEL